MEICDLAKCASLKVALRPFSPVFVNACICIHAAALSAVCLPVQSFNLMMKCLSAYRPVPSLEEVHLPFNLMSLSSVLFVSL